MRSKLTALSQALAVISYDVIALVETNLTSEISNSELGFNNYTVFRCDRSVSTSDKTSGGGSLIAVRDSIPCSILSSASLKTESVFVKFSAAPNNIILGCTYIPPNQHSSVFLNFCDSVDEVVLQCNNTDRILLMGDFNLPYCDWIGCAPTADESSRYILDLAATHGLSQVNTTTNYRGVLLDLVFSSITDINVVPTVDVLLPEDRHHPALDITITDSQPSCNHSVDFIQDFRNCDLKEVFRQCQRLSLPNAHELLDVDVSFSTFSRHLSHLISLNTPVKKVVKSCFPKWFSGELRALVIKKKIAHKRFKMSGHPHDLDLFQGLRRRCKALVTRCYADYIDKIEESIPNNVKSFWSHVNNLKCSSDMPSKMSLDASVTSEPAGKCALFSQHFSSVFCQSNTPVPSFDYGWTESLSQLVIRATDVQTKLEALDVTKGAGPDHIPPRVLKYCAPVLAVHLAVFFNASLSAGVFPSVLKQGIVVPIFKSGDRSNIKNYRPIVIQSALAKVFESLVLDHLYFFLRSHISDGQHGFLRGRSTVTNLLVFNEYVVSAFVDSCQVDCVYLDFCKAFDKVHFGLLVAKLAGHGVCGRLLGWLESYLINRELRVRCEGSLSAPFPVLSGVPQGSHLGPLLFILFINDITSSLSCDFLLFADDLKIYCRVRTTADRGNIQRSLEGIHGWCRSNAMELNVSKCHVVSFSRSNVPFFYDYHIGNVILDRADHVKDLGVVMSSTLSPLEHIIGITSRAYSLLGFIGRATKMFRSTDSLLILYNTLVRPILEYCSVVWSPYQLNHIVMLNGVQIRFTRVLGLRLGYNYLEVPIEELQHRFGIQPLQLRRDVSDLVLLFKLVNCELDCPELLRRIDICIPRGTRSKTVFGRRFLPTAYAYNSCLSRIQRSGGILASRLDFFTGTSQAFRRSLLALDLSN